MSHRSPARVLAVLLLLFATNSWLCCDSAAQATATASAPKTEAEIVKDDIRKLTKATMDQDLDTVMRYVPDAMLTVFGGAEKGREMMGKFLKMAADAGLVIDEIEFPAEPSFAETEKHRYVVVPLASQVSVGDKKQELKTFQVGLRPLNSDRWTYVEGMQVSSEQLKQLFPDFPSKEEFPAYYELKENTKQ